MMQLLKSLKNSLIRPAQIGWGEREMKDTTRNSLDRLPAQQLLQEVLFQTEFGSEDQQR